MDAEPLLLTALAAAKKMGISRPHFIATVQTVSREVSASQSKNPSTNVLGILDRPAPGVETAPKSDEDVCGFVWGGP